jgi:hypothetical protein
VVAEESGNETEVTFSRTCALRVFLCLYDNDSEKLNVKFLFHSSTRFQWNLLRVNNASLGVCHIYEQLQGKRATHAWSIFSSQLVPHASVIVY